MKERKKNKEKRETEEKKTSKRKINTDAKDESQVHARTYYSWISTKSCLFSIFNKTVNNKFNIELEKIATNFFRFK